jgi:hypothetical protein
LARAQKGSKKGIRGAVKALQSANTTTSIAATTEDLEQIGFLQVDTLMDMSNNLVDMSNAVVSSLAVGFDDLFQNSFRQIELLEDLISTISRDGIRQETIAAAGDMTEEGIFREINIGLANINETLASQSRKDKLEKQKEKDAPDVKKSSTFLPVVKKMKPQEGGFLDSIWKALKKALFAGALLGSITLIAKNWDMIVEGFDILKPKVVSLAEGVWSFVKDVSPFIIENFTEILQGMTALWVFTKVVLPIVRGITAIVPLIAALGASLLPGLAALTPLIGPLLAVTLVAAAGIVAAIDAVEQFKSTLTDTGSFSLAIKESLIRFTASFFGLLPDLILYVVAEIADFFGADNVAKIARDANVTDMFENMLSSLFDSLYLGMLQASNWVIDMINEKYKSFKGLFGVFNSDNLIEPIDVAGATETIGARAAARVMRQAADNIDSSEGDDTAKVSSPAESRGVLKTGELQDAVAVKTDRAMAGSNVIVSAPSSTTTNNVSNASTAFAFPQNEVVEDLYGRSLTRRG